MATIDDEIEALRVAIASGVKKVATQTKGVRKEVEYQSFKDMKDRFDFLCRLRDRPRPNITLASF